MINASFRHKSIRFTSRFDGFRRILALIAVFIATFSLCFSTFCELPASAGAPSVLTVEIQRNGSTCRLTWTDAEDATGYLVFLNGSRLTPTQIPDAELDVSVFVASAGLYEFSVQAYADSAVTAVGNCVYDCRIALSSPSGAVVENGVLKWNEVQNASGYEVKINALTVYKGAQSSFDLLSVCADEKEYSVAVIALGDGESTVPSSPTTLTYSAEHKLSAPQNVSLAVFGGNLVLNWSRQSSDEVYYYELLAQDGAVLANGTTSASLVNLGASLTDGNYAVKVRKMGKKSALCEFSAKFYEYSGGVLNELEA